MTDGGGVRTPPGLAEDAIEKQAPADSADGGPVDGADAAAAKGADAAAADEDANGGADDADDGAADLSANPESNEPGAG